MCSGADVNPNTITIAQIFNKSLVQEAESMDTLLKCALLLLWFTI